MVWGCLVRSEPGQLAVANGTMNSALYQNILQASSNISTFGLCSRVFFMVKSKPGQTEKCLHNDGRTHPQMFDFSYCWQEWYHQLLDSKGDYFLKWRPEKFRSPPPLISPQKISKTINRKFTMFAYVRNKKWFDDLKHLSVIKVQNKQTKVKNGGYAFFTALFVTITRNRRILIFIYFAHAYKISLKSLHNFLSFQYQRRKRICSQLSQLRW